jgi:hypothetical protein
MEKESISLSYETLLLHYENLAERYLSNTDTLSNNELCRLLNGAFFFFDQLDRTTSTSALISVLINLPFSVTRFQRPWLLANLSKTDYTPTEEDRYFLIDTAVTLQTIIQILRTQLNIPKEGEDHVD